jgi:hypothetical protein
MGDAEDRIGHRLVDGDPLLRLRGDERVERLEPGQLRQAQRFAEGKQLEAAPDAVPEAGDPAEHELGQRRRDPRAPGQTPQPVSEAQHALSSQAAEQLGDVQRVAVAELPDPIAHAGLHRATENRLDQLIGLGLVERSEREPICAGVLPQRLDRVRARLAGPQGHDDERRRRSREVEDERGRGVVEVLRVVDAENELPAPGELRERLRGRSQHRQRVVGAEALGQHPRERAERDRRRAAGRLHPQRRCATLLGRRERRPREPRLADPRRPGEHEADATGHTVVGDRLQLERAADKRRPRLPSHRSRRSPTPSFCIAR